MRQPFYLLLAAMLLPSLLLAGPSPTVAALAQPGQVC
jgi:hypothetical protein